MSAVKEQSILTHRDWLTAGKPREGPVASAMRSAKAEYKLYLKHMRMEEHNHFTNDLHESLAQKDVQSFNSKLSSENSCSKAVDGIYGSDGIAQHFRDVFSFVVQPNSPRLHHVFTQKYYTYGNFYSAGGN